MTGKVIWHVTMSLDGFIAGRDDSMDWVFDHAGSSALGDEVIRTIGAFLTGGRMISHDYGSGRNKPYGGAWTGPIFVFTHKDPATAPDPSISYLSGDIGAAVETGLRAADGKNLVVTGAAIPRLCVAAGLVDEIAVHLIPVLLGEGVRFFDSPGSPEVKLDMISAQTEQRADLRFRVVR